MPPDPPGTSSFRRSHYQETVTFFPGSTPVIERYGDKNGLSGLRESK